MLPDAVDAPVLHHGDALEFMRQLPPGCVHLVFADPPYYKVKGDAWDRQWSSAAAYLAWLGEIADEWRRVLAPNGSLYCCASPQMSARVEGVIAERFAVLNSIVWSKVDSPGRHRGADKGALRTYFPATERIIFAEQQGADSMAMGEAGYDAQCERLRGHVFESLRAYMVGEMERAGHTVGTVDTAWQAMRGTKGCMAGHWFGSTQWELPTERNYAWLRELFGADYLRREYADLRREYADLRREYESLRRPFAVSAAVPYTDVWTFPPVQHYKGKHPCEKPRDMLDHVITVSSRPGDLVLDCFAGSGVTAERAARLGRRFVGCEAGDYIHGARERVAAAVADVRAQAQG